MANTTVAEWVCTDCDFWQYQRKESKPGLYSMIQTNELPDGKWVVISDIIDVSDYSEKEIEDAVLMYYDTMDDFREEYGRNAEGIIAECLFENIGLGGYSSETICENEDEAIKVVFARIGKTI